MKTLEAHLRALGNGEIQPNHDCYGICNDVGLNFGRESRGKIYGMMPKWPEFTGDRWYPVPHQTMSPEDAFDNLDDLWSDDEYGDARRRLCLWLADQIKEQEE